jgi:hypothetical protein
MVSRPFLDNLDLLRSVKEIEREKPRQASGSAAVAGIHELSGLGSHGKLRKLKKNLFQILYEGGTQ